MYPNLLKFRYVSLIAVICLFGGAVLMFLVGLEKTLGAILLYFADLTHRLPAHLSEASVTSVALIQAVDAFLFALVLLIFAYGIYILFVETPGDEELKLLPRWMQVESIAELKTTLIQVIIVILAVNVLEHIILEGPGALKWETLIIPGAILCLAASLRLMHLPHEG
jgi:uncharacterized membrane protein YqhA